MSNSLTSRILLYADFSIVGIWFVFALWSDTDSLPFIFLLTVIRFLLPITLFYNKKKISVSLLCGFIGLCVYQYVTKDILFIAAPFCRFYDIVIASFGGKHSLLESAYYILLPEYHNVDKPVCEYWEHFVVFFMFCFTVIPFIQTAVLLLKALWPKHLNETSAHLCGRMFALGSPLCHCAIFLLCFVISIWSGLYMVAGWSLMVLFVLSAVLFLYLFSHEEHKIPLCTILLVCEYLFWQAQFISETKHSIFFYIGIIVLLIEFLYLIMKYKNLRSILSPVIFIAILPTLSIGNLSFLSKDFGRDRLCTDYVDSSRGVFYVKKDSCYGISDRYGLIMPVEYDEIAPLSQTNNSRPFFKFKKGNLWGIYDIVAQKEIRKPCFYDIRDSKESNQENYTIEHDLEDTYENGEKFVVTLYFVNNFYQRSNDRCWDIIETPYYLTAADILSLRYDLKKPDAKSIDRLMGLK